MLPISVHRLAGRKAPLMERRRTSCGLAHPSTCSPGMSYPGGMSTLQAEHLVRPGLRLEVWSRQVLGGCKLSLRWHAQQMLST